MAFSVYGVVRIWRMFLKNLKIVLLGSPGYANGSANALRRTRIPVGGKDFSSIPAPCFQFTAGPIGCGKINECKIDGDMVGNPHRLTLLSDDILPIFLTISPYSKSCELIFTMAGGLEKETIWRRISEEEMVCMCG